MLLDEWRIRARREGIFERTRGSARENSQRRRPALQFPCHPERSRGIPGNYLEVMPRDSSTPLRVARNDISAVLLTGGESHRMGEDKATLLVRGKLLWHIQLDLLRKLDPTEIFVSARTDPVWRPADVHFVGDDPPSRGPLSGVAASLAHTRTNHLLALAIDMPFMTEKYLRFLCSQIEPGRGVIAKIEDRFEPLAAIYPREKLASVQSALSGTDFSLQTLASRLAAVGKLQVVPVTSQERKLFLSVNEQADLAAL